MVLEIRITVTFEENGSCNKGFWSGRNVLSYTGLLTLLITYQSVYYDLCTSQNILQCNHKAVFVCLFVF